MKLLDEVKIAVATLDDLRLSDDLLSEDFVNLSGIVIYLRDLLERLV